MYFIAAFSELNKNELDIWKFGSIKTVGYFKNLEKARNIVEKKAYDFNETIYNYVIIEEVEENTLHPEINHQELYQIKNITVKDNGKEIFNNDLTYEKIDLPVDFPKKSIVIC